MQILTCWRCEQPGHGYADCQRPPAATRRELQARIDRLRDRWDAGRGLSTRLKQQFIAAEKREYDREKARQAK